MPEIDTPQSWIERRYAREDMLAERAETLHKQLVHALMSVREKLATRRTSFDVRSFSTDDSSFMMILTHRSTHNTIRVDVEFDRNLAASVCRIEVNHETRSETQYKIAVNDSLELFYEHDGTKVSIDEVTRLMLESTLFPD